VTNATSPRSDATDAAFGEIRVSSAGELLQVVPYLLGVRPEDSVVVLGLRATRVEVIVRADLSRLLTAGRPGWAELARRVGSAAEAAVLVVYGDRRGDAGDLPERRGVGVLAEALRRQGVEVLDALHVSCGRWRSYVCRPAGCSGPAAGPLRVEDPRSPVPAIARRAGLRALTDPAAVAADLAPPSGAAPRLRRHLERAETRFVAQVADQGGIGPWREDVDARFETASDRLARSRVSRAETAALVVALADRAVRDRCWEWVESGAHEPWLSLWRHLARHAIAPYRVEPLFLFAWTAWRRGDGISARVAVGCALQEDPEHRASGMLAELLRSGIDPRTLPLLTGAGPTEARLQS
jgi:hypothetical protein